MSATFLERVRIHAWLWFGEGFLIFLACTLCLLPLLAWLTFSGWPGWVAALLTWPAPVMGWSIIRQAFTHQDDDESPGIELHAQALPDLAAAIEQVRAKLGAPAPDFVYLDECFNAGIRQQRSLLGRTRNSLVLGLPLLEALDSEACTAILAHEFAHIAQRHGRYSSRLYFARQRWQAMGERIEKHVGLAHAPLRLFVGWYVPRLLRASYAFARQCEYQADAEAARTYGSRVMAQALIGMRIQSRALQSAFWPQRHVETAGGHFTELAHGQPLAEPTDRAHACTWLHDALREEVDEHSTHPSLAQRLSALEIDTDPQHADIPWQRPAPCAARLWLGDEHAALAQRMDARCDDHFQHQHERATQRTRAQRSDRHALLSKRSLRTLNADELAHLAWLERHLLAPGCEGENWLELGLALDAQHPWLMFQQAQRHQQQGDCSTASELWQALAEQPSRYQVSALHRLAEHALRNQDWAAARLLREQADELSQAFEQAPDYQPHGLPASKLEILTETLAPLLSATAGAWLLLEPGADHYLLVVLPRNSWLSRLLRRVSGEVPFEQEACEQLLERLMPRVELPVRSLLLEPSDPLLAHCGPASALHPLEP
ncbi:M48 family metallopeptidase [Pseudomonas entomophila]|uniref:Peptidase M48 domain-containing protein n=2 Tax=Pseudomonas entomophila TaxID=312306 RepID=Q1I2Y6_PSEE4|nr:M48 family metallopeptidase [Pseudomonas entomophila]WMW06312.1 M48 family metallopeptidase [Pseudomonas entomophila]CAK18000.1 hypothetical protein PSEEN5384 [Pseudomonas entomophila L48]